MHVSQGPIVAIAVELVVAFPNMRKQEGQAEITFHNLVSLHLCLHLCCHCSAFCSALSFTALGALSQAG
jgi:hypothetical protein